VSAVDAAITTLTAAIKRNDSDHMAYAKRSAAFLENGDASNALYDADRCIALKADWVKGYYLKGSYTL
jgi:hypothetical protein